jgi:hypothetical protein
MAHTRYCVSRRFGPLWIWEIVQGPAAPARGVAFSEAGARWAARNRVRTVLRQSKPDRLVKAVGDVDQPSTPERFRERVLTPEV